MERLTFRCRGVPALGLECNASWTTYESSGPTRCQSCKIVALIHFGNSCAGDEEVMEQ